MSCSTVYNVSFMLGFRGVVTLYNRMNYPAEFTWSPNIGEKGTAFSIRPAAGTFVWTLGYSLKKNPHNYMKCLWDALL